MASSIVGELAVWYDTIATHVTTARLPWVIIAGANAPAKVIAMAEYTCDGVADQTEINAALAVDDKRPIVLVGRFITSAAVAFTDGVKHDLIGFNEDYAYIQADHTGNALEIHSVLTPQEWKITIENLTVIKGATNTPARGISIQNGSLITFRNVIANQCVVACYSYFGLLNSYYGCSFNNSTAGLQLTGGVNAMSNANKFYSCNFRANDVGTLITTTAQHNAFYGANYADMATTDVAIKIESGGNNQNSNSWYDPWFEGSNSNILDLQGGDAINFIRPRFAIGSSQNVVKVAGFAATNVVVVDGYTDNDLSWATKPAAVVRVRTAQQGEANVILSGATGNGTTDDTAAVQRAIDSLGTTGGTVTGPVGTYLLSKTAAISHDSLSTAYCLIVNSETEATLTPHGPITFDFPRGTVFKLKDSQAKNTAIILINGKSTTIRTVPTTIMGITFDGNYSTQTAWDDHGLVTGVYAQDITLDRCEFKNYYYAGTHFLRDCRAVHIKRCYYNGNHAVTAAGSVATRIEIADLSIEACRFVCDAASGRGFIAVGVNADAQYQGRGMRILNNLFSGGYAGNSVDLSGVMGCLVEGNIFRDQVNNSSNSLTLTQYTNANTTWWESMWNIVRGNTFHNVRNGIKLSGNAAALSGNNYASGSFGNLIAHNMFTRDPEEIRTSPVGSLLYPARISPSANAATINLSNAVQIAPTTKTGPLTATAGAATTLTNGGASMGTTQYVGMVLFLTGGTGGGQSRKITSHTATVFTVPTWDVNPDATTTYVVCDLVGMNHVIGNKVWATNNSTKVVNSTSYLPNVIKDNEGYGTTAPFAFGNYDRYSGNKSYALPTAGDLISSHVSYQDDNGGTASILTGNTTIVVTHKLGRTPTASQIMVWPITTNGLATEWWVDTITSTQFTINVDINPAATYSFGWRAFGNP